MQVRFNGEAIEVQSINIADLLNECGFAGKKIAVELNREIILRQDYPSVQIKEGDTIEVVHFVGGG